MTDEPIYRISPPEPAELSAPPVAPFQQPPQAPPAAPPLAAQPYSEVPVVAALRERARRPPARWPGVGAFALAGLCLVIEIVAIAVGSSGAWTVATVLGVAVIVLSIVALVIGIVAIALRRGRGWGIAAVLVAVVSNPLVQLWVLGIGATS